MSASPVLDEAFIGAGQNTGLEIWRVKQFRLIKTDPKEHGKFFDGDSYVILSDEAGTATIKTIELDDLLSTAPVQHREVQNRESPLFLSYFKHGIQYLKGGYDTGFFAVQNIKFEPRLYHCKGRKHVRIWQVEVKKESLNIGDCFILDRGEEICVWVPPNCGNMEKVKGVRYANNIRDKDRAGKSKVHVIDQDWKTNFKFWEVFGGFDDTKFAKETKDRDFESVAIDPKQPRRLFRVSDASGSIKMEKVAEGKFQLNMLDSNDAFIMDAGFGGVFVWVGRKSNKNERRKSISYAESFIEKEKRPKWTLIHRVFEGNEPDLFLQWFDLDVDRPIKFTPRLYKLSDAKGKLEVEEICNIDQDDLSTDDVMFLDTRSKFFVWIGDKANANEKNNANRVAKEYMNDGSFRPGTCKIEVIKQGSEPKEFIEHFSSWDPHCNYTNDWYIARL